MMSIFFIGLMLVVVLFLAFYAGTLLYKLRRQTLKKVLRRKQRIDQLVESITTIAAAMAQQQCNMSEGCIRLYHLLEALPLVNRPDYSNIYPGVYALYEGVKDLASHQVRSELPQRERKAQDMFREEKEVSLESVILRDVYKLRNFSVDPEV